MLSGHGNVHSGTKENKINTSSQVVERNLICIHGTTNDFKRSKGFCLAGKLRQKSNSAMLSLCLGQMQVGYLKAPKIGCGYPI